MQRIHITDTNTTPILSTHPHSTALASLTQAFLTSNSAVEHLALGRIRRVHAKYVNGGVVQTAKLGAENGVIATVSGKEVRRSLEIDKILNVVHGALEGKKENEQIEEQNHENSQGERRKSDDGMS